MLWIGFSSDICKSDTSALVWLGCYIKLPNCSIRFGLGLIPKIGRIKPDRLFDNILSLIK
ncbi:hypothetical protein Hdeb2414_s0025g00659401 [Helianthus debilis subsp. tardiflorus]